MRSSLERDAFGRNPVDAPEHLGKGAPQLDDADVRFGDGVRVVLLALDRRVPNHALRTASGCPPGAEETDGPLVLDPLQHMTDSQNEVAGLIGHEHAARDVGLVGDNGGDVGNEPLRQPA